MTDRLSAEEFYTRCLHNAQVLAAAARREAARPDAVTALALAWGADVVAAQAVLWERILVAATTPQRQFFRVADALMSSLHSDAPQGDHLSAEDVLLAGREALLEACDPGLRAGLESGWTDPAYLAPLAAPTIDDITAAAGARLGGMGPGPFVARRRTEAAEAMAEGQALRIRSETVAAIQAAYEADFLYLDAYLVESAVAAGDAMLLTVPIRWELATQSVAQLAGLPESFVGAVAAIRAALADGLGDGDGPRFLATLPTV